MTKLLKLGSKLLKIRAIKVRDRFMSCVDLLWSQLLRLEVARDLELSSSYISLIMSGERVYHRSGDHRFARRPWKLYINVYDRRRFVFLLLRPPTTLYHHLSTTCTTCTTTMYLLLHVRSFVDEAEFMMESDDEDFYWREIDCDGEGM